MKKPSPAQSKRVTTLKTRAPRQAAPSRRKSNGPPSRARLAPAKAVTHLAGLLPERSSAPDEIPVKLRFYCPQAKEVFVAGEFNEWCPSATPLQNLTDGEWSVTLQLKRGTHEYRYVVDGRWTDDPLAARYAINPFGEFNGVIDVRPQA